MKSEMSRNESELRSQFDFSKAVRGKFHDRYNKENKENKVTLLEGEPDLDDPLDPEKQDSQLVEIAGKHLLISHLIAAGFEVAEPLRDKGIDLIVYRGGKDFVACPIQMKASSLESFSLDGKYERVPNLLIAYVWNVQTPERNQVYAMTFDEARKILERKGYDKTAAWKEKKYYFVRNAGVELKDLLAPYKMSKELWQQRLQVVS
jgi:hypothetical protein